MSLPLKVNRVDREPISSVRMLCRSDHYRNDELTVMESVSCCCSLPVKDREGRGEERRGGRVQERIATQLIRSSVFSLGTGWMWMWT